MTDPTLSSTDVTFTTSGGNTLTLYNAETETIRKSANLIPFNMPTQDSDKTIAFDLLGVTRDITVRGKFTTKDNVDIWKFADDLDKLVDGQQGSRGTQVGYTYTSVSLNWGSSGIGDRGAGNTKTIETYVNDVSYDFIWGEPNTLTYTLNLIEQDPTKGV